MYLAFETNRKANRHFRLIGGFKTLDDLYAYWRKQCHEDLYMDVWMVNPDIPGWKEHYGCFNRPTEWPWNGK